MKCWEELTCDGQQVRDLWKEVQRGWENGSASGYRPKEFGTARLRGKMRVGKEDSEEIYGAKVGNVVCKYNLKLLLQLGCLKIWSNRRNNDSGEGACVKDKSVVDAIRGKHGDRRDVNCLRKDEQRNAGRVKRTAEKHSYMATTSPRLAPTCLKAAAVSYTLCGSCSYVSVKDG